MNTPILPVDVLLAANLMPSVVATLEQKVKDIDTVAAELKRQGVAFTTEPTTIRPGVRVCFIRGPQGVSIELLERDPRHAWRCTEIDEGIADVE